MEKEHSAVCIGHRECFGVDEKALEDALLDLMASGVRFFYNGGMGGFDLLCARMVWKLKQRFPEVRQYLVIPYLSMRVSNREYYDEVIFPEGFERYSFKSAITARNRYMVRQAAHAVCYIEHGWGGAAKTYAFAVRQGCRVIQLGKYQYNTKKTVE